MAKETHSSSALAVETLLKARAVPEEVKHVFRRSLGTIQTADEMLWREVAARMTLDALGITPEATKVFEGMNENRFKAYQKTVQDARRWFRSQFEAADADEVFALWGGDIFPVRRAILALPPMRAPEFMRKKGEPANAAIAA